MSSDLVKRLRGGKCPQCIGFGEISYCGEMVRCPCRDKYEAPISMEHRNEAADRIEALEGENARLTKERDDARADEELTSKVKREFEARAERLRVALEDAIETMELAERIPFIDPDYGQEIEALGRRIGFGALMTSASASWAKVNAEMGLPAGGHFVAAPCHASVVQLLNKMRKALEDDKQ